MNTLRKYIGRKRRDWELEENGTRNTASVLDGKKYGTVYFNKDEDYYQYTATENGKVEFKFVNEDSVTEGYGWSVFIYDSNFKEISSKIYFRTDATLGAFDVKKDAVLYVKV